MFFKKKYTRNYMISKIIKNLIASARWTDYHNEKVVFYDRAKNMIQHMSCGCEKCSGGEEFDIEMLEDFKRYLEAKRK